MGFAKMMTPNPAIALRLQPTRLVGRVAELWTFGMSKQRGRFEQEATEVTETESTLRLLGYLLLTLEMGKYRFRASDFFSCVPQA